MARLNVPFPGRAIAALSRLLVSAALASTALCFSQEAPPPASAVQHSRLQPVPSLIRYQGALPGNAGKQLVLTFSIYETETGRSAIWQESQLVQLDSQGEFTVLLGAGSAIGLPQSLFADGQPRWLAVAIQGDSAQEKRALLTSVPYAMKAADADTLGGQPAAGFVTQDQLAASLKASAIVLPQQGIQAFDATTGTGVAGYLPIWTSASTLDSSAVFQTGSGTTARLGIGTAAPGAKLDVNGQGIFRGNLLINSGAATATAGVSSPFLQLAGSTYQSGVGPVAEKFQWRVIPVNNNTATPSANLSLLWGSGTATPASTGLSINTGGIITFAPGQNFASSAAAQFANGAVFNAESSFTGSSTDWMVVATNTSTTSKGVILGQAAGNELAIEGASPGGVGVEGLSTSGVGLLAQSTSGIGAEISSASATSPALQITNNAGGSGVIATVAGGFGGSFTSNGTSAATVNASNTGNGNAGYFANNSNGRVALAGVNSNTGLGAIGTYGSASNGMAVYGISPSGIGVFGTSTSSYGVRGTTSSGNGVDGTSGTGNGVNGNSTSGFGVEGFSGSNYGVVGESTNNDGVYGSSAAAVGVYGRGPSFGVAGMGSAAGAGVLGEIGTLSDVGGSFGGGGGVWGDGSSAGGIGVVGSSDNNWAGYFVNKGKTTAFVENLNGDSHTLFNILLARSPSGTCGIGGSGNLSCTGQVKALITTGTARQVETYSVQSSENWLEDFGSGTLINGRAIIQLDPAFADAANTGVEYHVFLTPEGDSQPLFIAHKGAAAFEVHEAGNGTHSIAFSYRIVAKRRGLEAQRLVDVTEKLKTEMEAVQPHREKQPQGQAENAP